MAAHHYVNPRKAITSKKILNYLLTNIFILDNIKLQMIMSIINVQKEEIFMRYICDVCGWVYDEAAGDTDNGIAPGTKWEDIPEDFSCPLCFVGKDQFSVVK